MTLNTARKRLAVNMYTYETTVHDVGKQIHDAIAAVGVPYCEYSISTLGGARRPSLMFRVSLDPRESWRNGIYQNSRFARFSVDHDGAVYMFTCSKVEFTPIRKFTAKLPAEAASRLVKWLDASMKAGGVSSHKTHRVGGKSYKVTAMFTGPQRVENANAWLEKANAGLPHREGHGVLAEANEVVYVAAMTDPGR